MESGFDSSDVIDNQVQLLTLQQEADTAVYQISTIFNQSQNL